MSSPTIAKKDADFLLPPPGLAAYFREQELKRIPVTTVQIHAHINNTCAYLRCVIRYQELDNDSTESIFTFPLDESSAISSFKAEVGNRKIVAKIQEKTRARETYERALENKQATILLEQDSRSDDVFTMRIGAIPKGESALIRLNYIRKLDVFSAHNESVAQWDWSTVTAQGLYPPRGSLSLILPTVLNPRYDPKRSDSISNATTNAIVLNTIPYDFQFTAKIDGSMKIQRVFSPTDYYETEYLNDDNTQAKVTLRITGEYERHAYNHDLQMLIEYEKPFEAHAFYEIISKHSEEKLSDNNSHLANTDVVMVNFMPNFYPENAPELVYEETLLDEKNEFVFLVDQSGSMTGIRNEQAKEALMLFLKSLPVGSFFQVIGYGSDFKSLFPQGAQEYNERNLRTAMRYKDDLEAGMGGTEILPALNHIFNQQVRHGHKRQLFLITDGEVTNTSEIIELVYRNRDQTTVFTVGIGEGASTALVKGVARAGGGRAEFIRDDDKNFSGRIISLLRSATQPIFESARIQINLPSGVSHTIVPRILPNIYQNRYTNVFIYLSGDLKSLEIHPATATLKGSILGREFSFSVNFQRPTNEKTVDVGFEMPIHLLGARTFIQEYTDSLTSSGYISGALFDARLTENERNRRITEIISISRVFNILSRYTAFVGVDEASHEVVGCSNLREIPIDNTVSTTSDFDQRNDSFEDFEPMPFQFGYGGGGRFRRDPHSGRSPGGPGRDPRDRERPRQPQQKPVTNLGSQQTQPSPYDSLPHFMREMMGLVSENSDVISTAVPPPPVLERTSVIRLAELVRVNGSWEAQHDVYRAINAKRDVVLNKKPENWTKDEWITLIVIIFLKRKCADKEEQWSMLVSKAYYWLSAFGRKKPIEITEKICEIYKLMNELFNSTS